MAPDSNRPVPRTAVIGSQRFPFMRMGTALSEFDLLDQLSKVVEGLVQKYEISGEVLGDVALGATFFHPAYWNVSRDTILKTSLSPLTPGLGIQRACATSLEATIGISNKIKLGQIESGIAGGAESMSNVPLFMKSKFARRLVLHSRAKSFKEKFAIWKGLGVGEILPVTAQGVELSTGKSMGEHCEMMVKEWGVKRQEQDELALASHQNGAKAFKGGFYDDLVMEVNGTRIDNNLRFDSSIEKLSKLRPAFDKGPTGSLTAGNSSPLTDGAAAVLLGSEEWARRRGLPVLAYVRDHETSAVDIQSEGLLMAPTYALPRMLKRNGLRLQDFDFYEIHEAFAGQVLCNLRAWESDDFCRQKLSLAEALGSIPRERLNVVGGSVALGHPFAATGARLVGTLAKLLAEKGSAGRGLISVCTGGGMGTVMILER
jgi:acetyl-CoA C-acetyltransferase